MLTREVLSGGGGLWYCRGSDTGCIHRSRVRVAVGVQVRASLMPQFYFWGSACKSGFCESQFLMADANNASFLIDWYVTSKQL